MVPPTFCAPFHSQVLIEVQSWLNPLWFLVKPLQKVLIVFCIVVSFWTRTGYPMLRDIATWILQESLYQSQFCNSTLNRSILAGGHECGLLKMISKATWQRCWIELHICKHEIFTSPVDCKGPLFDLRMSSIYHKIEMVIRNIMLTLVSIEPVGFTKTKVSLTVEFTLFKIQSIYFIL